MKHILSSLVVTMTFIAGAASAMPAIDPVLARQLANPAESQRVMSVALIHKNQFPLQMGMLPRGARQQQLMRNAAIAQRNTLLALQTAQRGVDRARIRVTSSWLANTVVVTAPARVIAGLLQNDQVLLARPARTYTLVKPYFDGRFRPTGAFTYGLEKLRIPAVRSQAADVDGRGVKVGILDTGIDAGHADLKGKTILFKDFMENQPNPYDDHSHGTHVAGTIAGGAASGTAIGVAPGASLIVGKIFDEDGSTTEDVILQAMQWVADPDGNPATADAPALVSNSWGGGIPSGDPKDMAECRAVDSWLALGVLPIFAAGNSGPSGATVSLPGGCPAALAVGATDQNDAAASFSSRGPARWATGSIIKPNVSAPGVKVLSSLPGGQYGAYSGTSMATPHTAGLAALLVQKNPGATPEAIANLLISGSIDLGAQGQDNTFGAGRIDAVNSLKMNGFRRH